ncbi:6964_t:CDS:10, partial [Paraglomus occultum]
LFVAACNDKFRVPNIIMSLYANHGSYPEPWQVFICRTTTTAEELTLFIKRCFFAAANGYKDCLYCIANLEFLEFELQYNLVKDIRTLLEREKNYKLALICYRERGIHHHILDQFSNHVYSTIGLEEASMKNMYRELCPNVACISSDLSGQGKTEYVKQTRMKAESIPKSVLISDSMHYDRLVRQLHECRLKSLESLHLNIVSVDNTAEVNMFIFEFLTLGMISNKVHIATLPKQVLIEIASTVDQYLLESLPIIKCLPRKHLTWNINNFIVSSEVHSPIQIVCRYLDIYTKQTIDDDDIFFDEPVAKQLPHARCRELIQEYFFADNPETIASYRFVEIFVGVLADQLVRLSSSSFFRVENLKLMMRNSDVRSTLLETLLRVSKDFATRSVESKAAQLASTAADADNARLATIVKWDDSNHLLVFFLSQTSDYICALYRDRAKVPDNVKRLLWSQNASDCAQLETFKLEDYHEMKTQVLQERLECIARTSMERQNFSSYALSADNLIKMALILLRARASIPVVVCGEAGCGKTSLIGYLAEVVGVRFCNLSLHAGIVESQILTFMSEGDKLAGKGEVWLFFDEINTCNHIGLLADLIAHRMLLGTPIHSNIRLFAACNPYRLSIGNDNVAGLAKRRVYQEQSQLVYQVHPLPDQILDYVWDFGVLKIEDEQMYIKIMIKNQIGVRSDLIMVESQKSKVDVISDLIFESQKYIREIEGPQSVSLRDVRRAIRLILWFHKSLQDRLNLKKSGVRGGRANSAHYPPEVKYLLERSIVLSLGLCYQARLYDQGERAEYRKQMARIFEKHKVRLTAEDFKRYLKEEQNDWMHRMARPPATALNEALLENVLVMIVCIMTRIPVFIIGAPGSSKSLAIRLVSSNLRGTDSKDEYFRKLPQVVTISHQGSSSSTSDGILKVFQKAEKIQKTKSDNFNLQTVVLLDGVGLAETSPFNPLKVLHALLEPSYPKDGPEVSIIGISNWRLDNSKSSRALLVQRPQLSKEDLVETALSLLLKGERKSSIDMSNRKIENLTAAYTDYKKNQKYPNFHGLRDYYALVKSLSRGKLTMDSIQLALARNFGGTDQMKAICEDYFGNVLKESGRLFDYSYDPIPVEKLIDENLHEQDARPLMIIGKSDSILNILTYYWRSFDMDPMVLCGSQFPDDAEGDYSYGILSRVMMCVEAGKPLILTDLDSIYGSLYDLWNQNYITQGSKDNPKYYTRIALGAYANPMCYVHPNFRCVLVFDEKLVYDADPPLLNRFEKQRLTINDTLTKEQCRLYRQLETWVKSISTIMRMEGINTTGGFTEADLFIGYDKDETLQSLVIDECKKSLSRDNEDILERCKERLIKIASSDGLVRATHSVLAIESDEVINWTSYFDRGEHDHIAAYFGPLIANSLYNEGYQLIIHTFSNINTDVKGCLEGILKCQVDKLSTFKAEAQLQSRVKHFWFESDDELLLLQCDLSTTRAGNIRLAKLIIEQLRNEYFARRQRNEYVNMPAKHACIILHHHRDQTNTSFFNFMCGWEQVTIETLVPQEKPLSALIEGDLGEVINSAYPFEEILQQELLWCLLCIKYPDSSQSIEHVRRLIEEIPNKKAFVDILKMRIMQWIDENTRPNWRLRVASDKSAIYLHSSFADALLAYIRVLVRKPIAQLLYALEKHCALLTFFNITDDLKEDEELIEFWKSMYLNKKIIDIEAIKEPGPDGYSIASGLHDLHFPFSYYFMNQINSFKKIYVDDIAELEEDENNFDENGELNKKVVEAYLDKFEDSIFSALPTLRSAPLRRFSKLYFRDFVTVIASNHGGAKITGILMSLLSRLMGEDKVLNPILLHVYWWTKSNAVLAQMQLASLFPTIMENLDDYENYGETFEQLIVNKVSRIFLDELQRLSGEEDIHSKAIKWQLDVTHIMSLCVQLPGYKEVILFQLLRICNDLLSTQAIPVDHLTNIINFDEDFLSANFLNDVLNTLDNLEPTEKNLTSRQSFLLRFLNMIENDSEVQLFLYDKIFQPAEPLRFTAAVILRIISAEDIENDNILLLLVRSPTDVFAKSRRLEAINRRLKMHDPNTQMITLCCDIIQQKFSELNLQELSGFFHDASQAIRGTMSEPLQRICSIALLKQFVQEFWESAGLDKPTVQQIEFNFMLTDDIQTLIVELNNAMGFNHPQIHSLKVYFLKNLRSRGFTIGDLKTFCTVQKGLLPWLANLPWDYVNQTSRIPFNPYGLLQEYGDAEIAYTTMTRMLDKGQLGVIVKNALEAESLNSRIALIGIIVNHLYGIRASREMTYNENEVAEFLQGQIDENKFSASYKHLALNLITNSHALLTVRQQTDNAEFIMRLVLVHIIAVHASLPAESSPLTLYLQELPVVRNHFILTCPSDEETMIINALNDAHPGKGISRYQCQCGYKYFVADCGDVMMALRCPDCAADLGGHQYGVPAAGQRRLDDKPIKHNVGNKDKPGYIVEDVMEDARRNVRALTSAAYRILHLFVHALIGVSAPSPNVNAFLNANGNPINDPIAYCRNHITNDWAILKTLLACDDETLALIIHSILYSIMADKPNMDAHIKTAAARDQWEQYFRDKYVTPIIRNVAATAMDMRTKMERAEPEKQKAALETEINETLLLTDEYSKNHLPGLWRKVVDVNRESFAVYFANNEQYKAAFPFINVFFKHEEKLLLVKHLWSIVKFTQTLTSRLTYRLTRQKAQQTTFRDFITNEEQN